MNSYDKGDLLRLSGTFLDASSGEVTDPQNVFLQYKNPVGVIVTLTYGVDAALIRNSTGFYYADISLTSSGSWWYRFYSTGEGQAAGEDKFFVRDSQFD